MFQNHLKIAAIERSRRELHENGLRLILNYFEGGDRSSQSLRSRTQNVKKC